MSKDEEAATIGRMALERKELAQRATVIGERVRYYSIRLKGIGLRLEHAGGTYQQDPVTSLTDEEMRVMSSSQEINALLAEGAEAWRRHRELDQKLRGLNL